jgi:hypothetical protein
MELYRQPILRRLQFGWLLLVSGLAGCRTMPADDKPFTHTRTYHATMAVDPEPHVLNVTVHPPTRPLDYTNPRRLHLSILSGTALQLRDTATQELFGRTLAAHSVGHVMIELKTTDPATGHPRYLITAVNTADPGEWTDQAVKQKIGYSIFTRGVGGTIDPPDRVANDADEPAEVGIESARLRVLLSPEAAARMVWYYEQFVKNGTWRRFALVSDPLSGDGASCASLAATLLTVGGLLTPDMRAEWQRTLLVPAALVGDPEVGKKVALGKLFVGPQVRRWATPCEPHRRITYYDTALMHAWIARHSSGGDAVECQLERLLAMPVVTLDARHIPSPSLSR